MVHQQASRLHGTHVTPYGTVIFYTKEFAGEPESSSFGFVLAEQRGRSWVTRDVQETYTSGRQFVPKFVFVTGTVHDLNGRVGSTWGRALKPGVAAVEVMFNDGQVVRDAITPKGMFIVDPNKETGDGPGISTIRVCERFTVQRSKPRLSWSSSKKQKRSANWRRSITCIPMCCDHGATWH